MSKKTFRLLRVTKGMYTNQHILHALRNPSPFRLRRYTWSVAGLSEHSVDGAAAFVGRLVRYLESGTVKVVEPSGTGTTEQDVDNLLDAESTFVYLPDHAVVAAQHVWNAVPSGVFEERFSNLVERSQLDLVLGSLVLNPITSPSQFAERMKEISVIDEIDVSVAPSNPYYGHFWKQLQDFLKRRGGSSVSIRERAGNRQAGIVSELGKLVKAPAKDDAAAQPHRVDSATEITDAAVLMALDGYGKGVITGRSSDSSKTIIVATSEMDEVFAVDATTQDELLARAAVEAVQRVNREHGLEHP